MWEGKRRTDLLLLVLRVLGHEEREVFVDGAFLQEAIEVLLYPEIEHLELGSSKQDLINSKELNGKERWETHGRPRIQRAARKVALDGELLPELGGFVE